MMTDDAPSASEVGLLTVAQVREVALKHHQRTKMAVFVGGIDQDFVDALNVLIKPIVRAANADALRAPRALITRIEHNRDESSLFHAMVGVPGETCTLMISKELRDSCPCKADCLHCALEAALSTPEIVAAPYECTCKGRLTNPKIFLAADDCPIHGTRLAAQEANNAQHREIKTALRIMLSDKPGAAQNAVREDYPWLAEVVDASQSSEPQKQLNSEVEPVSWQGGKINAIMWRGSVFEIVGTLVAVSPYKLGKAAENK